MAARMGGGGRARARSGISGGLLKQQPSSSSSSSRGGYGRRRAPMAAWEAAARRTQLGSRWSRPEASQGRVARTPGGRSIIRLNEGVGLVRWLERPLRPQGRLTGRREERRRWPQRARRRRRRFGRPNRRWRQRRRSLRRLGRPSEAAAEQQQKQQQRRLWAPKGACGGLGGGAEACAVGEPLEPPGGIVGARRELSRRWLNQWQQSVKKKCRVVVNVSLDCVSA